MLAFFMFAEANGACNSLAVHAMPNAVPAPDSLTQPYAKRASALHLEAERDGVGFFGLFAQPARGGRFA